MGPSFPTPEITRKKIFQPSLNVLGQITYRSSSYLSLLDAGEMSSTSGFGRGRYGKVTSDEV